MTEPIRVMWLIKGLDVGGAEQLLANSVRFLDRSRFQYEIAYIVPDKSALVSHFAAHDIPVFSLDGKGILDCSVVLRLANLLKERKVDILDSHLPYSGVIGRIAARLAGTKGILYTEHDLAPQKRIKGFHFATFIPNVLTYRLNHLIITVSQATYRDVQQFNFLRTPVRVVYNGIDLDALVTNHNSGHAIRQSFNIPDDHLIVGHVAVMRSEKRQDILLRAAKIVLARCPKTTFVLVSQGPLLNSLKQLTRELGIEDNVVFTGFVDDIFGTMSMFDIFALSSVNEGLPTVVIEALAMSKPVVSTRAGGTSEIITDGVDGFLTKLLDPVELADKITTLLQDGELRTRMGQSGQKTMRERFDIRRRVREVENIYEELAVADNHRSIK